MIARLDTLRRHPGVFRSLTGLSVAVFDARPDGVTGHYVATVVFAHGQSTWEIRQGWFELPNALAGGAR